MANAAVRDSWRDDRPELVQPEDWAHPKSTAISKTPVFLIHDGGGTTFAYHCLNPLYRFIYGIRNPNFFTGAPFEGGLSEMGRLYAKRISSLVAQPSFPAQRKAKHKVDIFLGGWSLGGLLSLEVARVLADDVTVNVLGILMIDSIYPVGLEEFVGQAISPDDAEEVKNNNKILARRCMSQSRRMLRKWSIPKWEGRLSGQRPKIVLLKATGYVPTRDTRLSILDVNREDTTLGWGDHDDTMFEAVFAIEGHHYDLFEPARVPATTETIRKGFQKLDEVTKAFSDGQEETMLLSQG